MSDALINVSTNWSEEDFAIASTSGAEFLPRIQLMSSNSEKCKAGEFPVNNFALIDGEEYKDIGKEVDAVLITRRPKAIEFGEQPLSSYDPRSELFESISARAAEKDSGCMYGTEYLLWLPAQKVFATFFYGSASARRECKTVNQFVGHGVTFKAKKISTAKYTWFIPTCVECTSLTSNDLPEEDKINSETDRFINPPAPPKIEMAEEAPTDRER